MAKKAVKAKIKEAGENGPGKGKLSQKVLWLASIFLIFIALAVAFLLLSQFGFNPVEETEQTPITGHLVEFYGRECPHCTKMVPIVSEVESELNVTFSKLEVWHNSGNDKVFNNHSADIVPQCGDLGVPTFYSTKTKKALCGEVDKNVLLAFAREN